MQPKAAIAPKKITTQKGAASKKKKACSPRQKSLNREEKAELVKLAALLPASLLPASLRSSPLSDPASTLLQTVSYIQQLVNTVHAKVQNGSLPIENLAALNPALVVRPKKSKRRSIEKKRFSSICSNPPTSVTRQPRQTSHSVNSKGRVRKSSEERKEKQKVESALRQLVGSSSSSQLDLVLSAIKYIRQLQSQLDIENTENRENGLPEGFEQLFEKTVKA